MLPSARTLLPATAASRVSRIAGASEAGRTWAAPVGRRCQPGREGAGDVDGEQGAVLERVDGCGTEPVPSGRRALAVGRRAGLSTAGRALVRTGSMGLPQVSNKSETIEADGLPRECGRPRAPGPRPGVHAGFAAGMALTATPAPSSCLSVGDPGRPGVSPSASRDPGHGREDRPPFPAEFDVGRSRFARIGTGTTPSVSATTPDGHGQRVAALDLYVVLRDALDRRQDSWGIRGRRIGRARRVRGRECLDGTTGFEARGGSGPARRRGTPARSATATGSRGMSRRPRRPGRMPRNGCRRVSALLNTQVLSIEWTTCRHHQERSRGWSLSQPRGTGPPSSSCFERYRARLRRMVALRLDPRLQGRVDASDIIQEGYLDAMRRLEEFVRDPSVPFYIWLRFLVGQRVQEQHRRHLGRPSATSAARCRSIGRHARCRHRGPGRPAPGQADQPQPGGDAPSGSSGSRSRSTGWTRSIARSWSSATTSR